MFRAHDADEGDALLTRLGALTAQARELAKVQRSRVELAVALQRGMLPQELPEAPGFRLAVGYVPAHRGLYVGGDWYDAFTMPDGRIGLSIGDVQGHNIEAAAFMGQVRVGLRALAHVTNDPGELLARTNDLLVSLGADLFATCTFLRLDPATGVLECARAGHIPHIWATADGRSGAEEGECGPPLGVLEGAEYPVTCHRLTAGSVVVLLTDGVVEGPSLSLDEGLRRVRGLAEINAGAGLGARVLADGVMRLADRVGHEDDAAVLIISHEADAGQRQLPSFARGPREAGGPPSPADPAPGPADPPAGPPGRNGRRGV
ncbi:PP2C family protein-serine/threonine phosphatase [Streptomyces sp. NPDC088745]|uniref:PP2C family protein-serine/threonine phosphatase n=1 Tax=Streptomyces sp. NPDC088745 TaxID=3365884 RepID=UPI00381CD618